MLESTRTRGLLIAVLFTASACQDPFSGANDAHQLAGADDVNQHVAEHLASNLAAAEVYTPRTTAATAGSVLIYGPTLTTYYGLNERQMSAAAGHTVTVASAATWSAMTVADFAAYDAIIIPERCEVSPALLSAAESNRHVWSSAVDGNMVIIGNDPLLHARPDGLRMVDQALDWVTTGSGTGLYVNLGCIYALSSRGTAVDSLDRFGSFVVGGQEGCPATNFIQNGSHPVTTGLSNAGLNNWGCGPHLFFLGLPPTQQVLATALRPADNAELPWLLATVGNRSPDADAGGPYSGDEGSAVAFNASASSDPDGDPLTYAWNFGDGQTGSGATPTHSYADNGSYLATVTVTDGNGGSSTASASVTVQNVAPSVDAGADATIESGDTFSLGGSFSDPGVLDAPWTGTIDWGDGTTEPGYTGSHGYLVPGTYTVTITVTDKDGGTGSDSVDVTVVPLAVEIDIDDCSDSNPVDTTSREALPVVILSSSRFDATTIDRDSIRLGPGGARPAHASRGHVEDSNEDGIDDLLTHYRPWELGLTTSDTSACLTGVTTDGVHFADCDLVTVLR